VRGDDGLHRCPWGAGDPVNLAYHDTEWGVRVSGESAHLERLTLEAFQSGLSWRTILLKRENFRAAFAGFDADTVAAYGPPDVDRLMADAGIVRNRRKVDAAIANARATVALREQGGLEAFIWSFRPEPGSPTSAPPRCTPSWRPSAWSTTTSRAATAAAAPADGGQSGLRQTETWLSLSLVKGAPCQSATRRSSDIPASWAIRSHSAGQM
jgi:DNA-3-methyladenine glycosylase I